MLLLVLPVLRSDLPVSDKLGGLAAHKEVLLRAIAIKETEVIRRQPGILCNCHQVPTCGKRRGVRKSYVLCSSITIRLSLWFLYHDIPRVVESEYMVGQVVVVWLIHIWDISSTCLGNR